MSRLLEDFTDAEVAIVAAVISAGASAVGKDPAAERVAVRLNVDLAAAVNQELHRRKIRPVDVGDDLLTRLRTRLLERYELERAVTGDGDAG